MDSLKSKFDILSKVRYAVMGKKPYSQPRMTPSISVYDVDECTEDSYEETRRPSTYSIDSQEGTSSMFNIYTNLSRMIIRRFSNKSISSDERDVNERKSSICSSALDVEGNGNQRAFDPYDYKEVPQYLAKMAETELNETPENRAKALEELRRLIRNTNEDFQKQVRTDEFFLLAFLRVKKFESPRAWDLISNFYEFKLKHYDIHPFNEQIFLHEFLVARPLTVLPFRDRQKRVIYLLRMGKFNPVMMPFDQMLSMAATIIATLVDDPVNQVTGVVVVIDFANVSLRWFTQLGIRNTRFLLFLFLNALPIRHKGIHLINYSILFKPVQGFIRAFASKKIKERFHFHGRDMKSLHRYVPAAILPAEYGGTLECEEILLDTETILSNRILSGNVMPI